MANLKGGNFTKQIKDAFHRLEAFGVGRSGTNDNLTHSNKLREKRDMFMKDLCSYFEERDQQGKLNELLTKENLDDFFSNRLEGLASSTRENYLRGISSMFKGLECKNIDIPLHTQDKDYFDKKVAQIKEEGEQEIENRYVNDVNTVINDLYEHRQISGLIAEVQNELSLRQEEAFELIRNPTQYIDHGIVEGLIGKGNHIYEPKEISFELEQKILTNTEDLISKSSYWNDLQRYNISSHDFRFTSARDMYEKFLSNGMTTKDAKLKVSFALNHKRESITAYYLKYTEF